MMCPQQLWQWPCLLFLLCVAGENPLESLNPGQVLTATVANRSTVLALDVILIADDFEHNTATNFFGLRPGLSSTWKWTFHSSTQQIQLATDPKHCLSSRTDLTALTLQPCQSRGQQYFKQQAWEWYAGQLRNAGDGKCLVANGSEDLPLLKPLACNKVQASNRVSWSFGGECFAAAASLRCDSCRLRVFDHMMCLPLLQSRGCMQEYNALDPKQSLRQS